MVVLLARVGLATCVPRCCLCCACGSRAAHHTDCTIELEQGTLGLPHSWCVAFLEVRVCVSWCALWVGGVLGADLCSTSWACQLGVGGGGASPHASSRLAFFSRAPLSAVRLGVRMRPNVGGCLCVARRGAHRVSVFRASPSLGWPACTCPVIHWGSPLRLLRRAMRCLIPCSRCMVRRVWLLTPPRHVCLRVVRRSVGFRGQRQMPLWTRRLSVRSAILPDDRV